MTHGNFLPKELRPSYRVLGQYTAVFWLILTFLGSGVSGRPPGPEAGPTAPARWLSLEERVSCQWAIERVYWRHRIWPRENPQPKPALEAVVSEDAVRAKVEDGLRKSAALGRYWGHFLRPEDLQAEMDRMGRQTRRPEVLRELFAALGGDANRVAECLVRPLLAERWIRSRYAWDERFHGALRERVKAEVGGWEETGGVRGLRGLSGRYEEVEWVKVGEGRGGRAAVEVPAEEWAEREGELAEVMGWERRSIPVGRVSGLREDEERLYVGAVLERGEGRMVVATVVWEKRAFEDWWSEVRGGVGLEEGRSGEGGYVYHLPAVNATACVDDTWERIPKASSPSARAFHTAVWTGTEMIVWGGDTGAGFTNTGGRYNPGTDTWTATSTTNAPSARLLHTAVWTGTEMIVWGGDTGAGFTNTGGRYNPGTDTWTATQTMGAPEPRIFHTAVWTGAEMIVWGGAGNIGALNTGGRYNPATDTWTATSTASAPSARAFHTAVWTGTEMIVWGGSGPTDTGGRYNPGTNTWTATNTTNAPSARRNHTAVWTGAEMIVWGGCSDAGCSSVTNTGGRYNPAGNTWTATSLTNAPSARDFHTAIWTGAEMIVWGGATDAGVTNTGGRYDPAFDTWTATSTTNAPSARRNHTAVWTGTEVIVWGGCSDAGCSSVTSTGGRYDPATDAWTATSLTNAPSARDFHTAVWTGTEMIVWGGATDAGFTDTGGRYNPATDAWTATSLTDAPSARSNHTAVWTGTQMIVWGGCSNFGCSSVTNTGGRYDPATDNWKTTSLTNAPSARADYTAVWTGTEMIVWGGVTDAGVTNTGGRYDPAFDTWTATSPTNAPSARVLHTAVWTGTEMIVWGGRNSSTVLGDGGRYCANRLPFAQDDAYTTQEDTFLNVPSPGVLGNDTDPEGQPLTAVLMQSPTQGTLTLNADGSFTYMPNPNFCGLDFFEYVASDGVYSSPFATVTLTVVCQNDPPVAQDDAYITQEDTPLNAPSPGVLGNDTDPEGQPLTAVLVSGPTQGTLTLNADGSFTYTPNPNFCILDSFTYAASDGGHLSNVATVLLMVVCQNDPPVAQDDAYTTQEGTPLNVPSPGVLGNDTDPDIWDPLTAVLDSGPTQGSLTLNADGSFTYTPNSNFCGLDSFTYRAFDGSLQSNVATVTLTVTCPTMSPVGLTLLNVGPEGVWDSGEAVTVVPAWQNNSAQAVTAAGTASNVVNPPGVAASLTDTAADYGTIPAGGTADCQAATGNCYGITGSRTVWGHRDVTLDETVNGTFGVHRAFVQTWVLHMGPSFADVGVTDFFYRHVETLLHRGITAGCTATTYCPFNSVLRYQMAIFISRSKLGGDPPAAGSGPGGSWDCTDGNPNPFTDVPDGAFYCPHVHWMWANNITSGCTATTYCPGDPVNRAQTAVFLVRAFQLVLYGP